MQAVLREGWLFKPERQGMNMKVRSFTVVIEKDPAVGLYVGEVPGLTGCHSQGKTIDELLRNMKEVIELVLEVKGAEHIELPQVVGIQQIEVGA